MNVGKKIDGDLVLRKSQIAGQFVLDKTIKIWDVSYIVISLIDYTIPVVARSFRHSFKIQKK